METFARSVVDYKNTKLKRKEEEESSNLYKGICTGY